MFSIKNLSLRSRRTASTSRRKYWSSKYSAYRRNSNRQKPDRTSSKLPTLSCPVWLCLQIKWEL